MINFDSYLQLAKPRITLMVLVTTAMGFFLGGLGIYSIPQFTITLIGVGLASAGASALNQYLERDADSLMTRTQNRPIPSGKINSQSALSFGVLFVLLGVGLLSWKVNLLTGFLVLLTAFLYVLVYTPLKRFSWLNTSIGAIPGAIPPVAGWTAATGNLDLGAWVLFWILFMWQHPHFFAIAWMYKEEYKRAGFQMLPVVEPDGKRMFRQIIWHSVLLIPISLLLTLIGATGMIYLWGALILGFGFLFFGLLFSSSKSTLHARYLLRASIIYLPFLLILIVVDSGF